MIINIYKEKGWTSFDVVAKVRNILNIKKVGHAGTLDPLAEGVLIVLTDYDTKKQQSFMELEKEYNAKIAFGIESETYDLEGPFTFKDIPEDFDLTTKLDLILSNYIGKFDQTVPPYSAVKVKGKRLYKHARTNPEFFKSSTLPKKEVTIYELTVGPAGTFAFENRIFPCVELQCVCSKGTYMRSLAHDLGEDIGLGGTLVNLVRTRVGSYTFKDSIKVAEIQSKM